MPKKKNAFWTFLLEYKREHKIESQEEAMKKADAVWRAMDASERRMYAPKKGVNTGNQPLREIEVKYNEEALFQQTMVEEITSELSMAKKYNNLSSYRFFIIHVNSFCFHDQLRRYYPCEIAISSFTLRDGVSPNDVYHAMVYPGPLPNGYSASARMISERSHQIPWEYDDVDNTDKIFAEVVDFLMERSKGSSMLPILYTRKQDMEAVKNVFEVWCEEFNPRMTFTVYNIQTLFSILHKNIITNEAYSSESLTYIEIEKDVHSFASGIACEYHDSADVQVYCARSIAIRFGYVICQTCCPGLGIDLIPGQHVPSDMKFRIREDRGFSSGDETNSSIRVDTTSDAETISSFGISSRCDEDTASSINFPEYDNCSTTSEGTIIANHGNQMSGNGSLSNDLTSRTGSSGFSRKPAALPSNVYDGFGKLTMSQESMERRAGLLASLRGRGGAVPKGKGRGHPFRK